MANKLALLVTAATTVVAIAAFSTGCASDVPDEDEGTSSSAQTATQCAPYPTNPACSAPLFLNKAAQLANEDPKGNLVEPIQNAKTCIGNLVKGGAVAVGTGGVGFVIVSAARAKTVIETFYACKDLAEYLGKLGIPENVSCWLQPVVNDKKVQLCECTQMCNGGVDREGPDGRLQTVKLKYGYLDRIGSARCYCTNSPKEKYCQYACRQWASTDTHDCTCATP